MIALPTPAEAAALAAAFAICAAHWAAYRAALVLTALALIFAATACLGCRAR